MSSEFVSHILSKELTSMPNWIRTISGNYYNNALCNEATWMLIFWKIIHVNYSTLFNIFLKQKRIKSYIRTRLVDSLWFLGFFASALGYYSVLNDNKFGAMQNIQLTSNDNVLNRLILTHTAMCTFYLHTAFVEGVQKGSLHMFLKYTLLAVVCTGSFILRQLDIPFTLSAVVGVSVISNEVTKIFYCLLNPENTTNRIFVLTLYVFSLVLFGLVHLVTIPLILLVPIGKNIFLEKKNDVMVFILFLSLLFWLGSAVYNSVLVKSAFHWIDHTGGKIEQNEKTECDETVKQKVNCPGNIIECSMFRKRTDDAYMLGEFKKDVYERKMEMQARKKPKNNNIVLQTLKCMLAVKRKLRQRGKIEISESKNLEENKDDNTEDDSEVKEEELVEEEEDMDDEAEINLEELNINLNEDQAGNENINETAKEDQKENLTDDSSILEKLPCSSKANPTRRDLGKRVDTKESNDKDKNVCASFLTTTEDTEN